MTRLYDPTKPPLDTLLELPQPVSRRFRSSNYYRPSDDLVRAVNVSLLLGQPLLLTGEPGTGKTQLAFHVAYNLGLEEPIRFDVKSSTEARDLFYGYDGLREFRESRKDGAAVNSADYVSLQALGLAILLAREPAERGGLPKTAFPERLQATIESAKARRSVVLIDEIDKAPRDVPNDLLNEIENNRFWSPELRRGFDAPAALRPIVILTSNSERGLPDAFLRRCTCFHIEFPNAEELKRIIAGHFGSSVLGPSAPLVNDATDILDALRDATAQLKKKPGVAEVLAWLAALLHVGAKGSDRLLGRDAKKAEFEQTLPALVKNVEDRKTAIDVRDGLSPN